MTFASIEPMFAVAAIAVLISLALAVFRAILGPTMFDRVLAGNSVGSMAILLLSVVGFLTGRPEWLDLALTYGLLNLVGTLAVLKFFRHGDLAHDARAPDMGLAPDPVLAEDVALAGDTPPIKEGGS